MAHIVLMMAVILRLFRGHFGDNYGTTSEHLCDSSSAMFAIGLKEFADIVLVTVGTIVDDLGIQTTPNSFRFSRFAFQKTPRLSIQRKTNWMHHLRLCCIKINCFLLSLYCVYPSETLHHPML